MNGGRGAMQSSYEKWLFLHAIHLALVEMGKLWVHWDEVGGCPYLFIVLDELDLCLYSLPACCTG